MLVKQQRLRVVAVQQLLCDLLPTCFHRPHTPPTFPGAAVRQLDIDALRTLTQDRVSNADVLPLMTIDACCLSAKPTRASLRSSSAPPRCRMRPSSACRIAITWARRRASM